jgi:glycosyltransferase involved in cell wall biosynthesis
VTIHDLASVRYPETLTPWSRIYERALLPRIAHAAARVIAPSSDTASDIETILRVPASKIRIVPLGVDATFFEQGHTKPPFDFPYVLFVGTPQPRKNLGRLADAIRLLSHRGSDLRLVVAGSDGWGASTPNAAHMTFVGRVSDQQLRTLYQHSACLALVSLHEGFGLPVLEAMAIGTPVVASNVAALPEVTGGAAVLVDPLNVASIADGIEEAIARKDVLVPAGRAIAARRSWKEAAQLTLAVYREIAPL